jgi:hypothetical protein
MDEKLYRKEGFEKPDSNAVALKKTDRSSLVSDKKINKLLGILAYLESNPEQKDN